MTRRRPRTGTLLLTALIAGLAGVVAYALQREMLTASATAPAAAAIDERELRRALSAEEETYAAALWPLHGEVKLAAIRMTFAGIAYSAEDHDPDRLAAKVEPLGRLMAEVASKVRSLQPPASLREVHRRYVEALALYAAASDEMLRGAAEGRQDLLIEAQGKSFRASEDLLRVGDVLWPGEYKPH